MCGAGGLHRIPRRGGTALSPRARADGTSSAGRRSPLLDLGERAGRFAHRARRSFDAGACGPGTWSAGAPVGAARGGGPARSRSTGERLAKRAGARTTRRTDPTQPRPLRWRSRSRERRSSACGRTSAPRVDIAGDRPSTTLTEGRAGRNGRRQVAYGTAGGLFRRDRGIPTLVGAPADIARPHEPEAFVELSQLAACERLLARPIEHGRARFVPYPAVPGRLSGGAEVACDRFGRWQASFDRSAGEGVEEQGEGRHEQGHDALPGVHPRPRRARERARRTRPRHAARRNRSAIHRSGIHGPSRHGCPRLDPSRTRVPASVAILAGKG